MLKGKKSIFKLYYITNVNFRAQIIRSLLNWAKVDWEDIKLTKEEFEKMKSEGNFNETFSSLPILEYKGNYFSQSHGIEYYLSKKFRLLGADLEEEYEILNVLFLTNDIADRLFLILFPQNQEDEKHQIDNLKKLISDFLPRAFNTLENNLIKNNSHLLNNETQSSNTVINYYIGNKISLADFTFGTFFYSLINNPLRKELLLPVIEVNAPKLWAYMQNLVEKDLKSYYDVVFIKSASL